MSVPRDTIAPPRVAVIVPAYGVAHLLGEALASLLAQTATDWECIVIDDGAPDDVAGAVRPFLSDPRIRFMATANHGVSSARNTAIRASRAPLIALLDGDDLLRPNFIARMCGVLEGDRAIRLVTTNARKFGAVSGESLCIPGPQAPSGRLSDVLDRSFRVYIGSVFRREDFDAIGGFDVSMAQSEDFDLWSRLMLLGGAAHYIDAVLGEYRVRAGSASANAGRLFVGNLRVYEKVLAQLPDDAPERDLTLRMIAETRSSLAFEGAIDQVIAGDPRRGVNALRAARSQLPGALWRCAFAAWQVFPQLARPMLSWRRRQHARGGHAPQLLPSLAERGI